MAALRLVFFLENFSPRKICIYKNPSWKTVQDLRQYLIDRFELNHDIGVFTKDNFFIPAEENLRVIGPEDVVRVKSQFDGDISANQSGDDQSQSFQTRDTFSYKKKKRKKICNTTLADEIAEEAIEYEALVEPDIAPEKRRRVRKHRQKRNTITATLDVPQSSKDVFSSVNDDFNVAQSHTYFEGPDEQLEESTPEVTETADCILRKDEQLEEEEDATVCGNNDELLVKEEAAVAVIPEVSEITPALVEPVIPSKKRRRVRKHRRKRSTITATLDAPQSSEDVFCSVNDDFNVSQTHIYFEEPDEQLDESTTEVTETTDCILRKDKQLEESIPEVTETADCILRKDEQLEEEEDATMCGNNDELLEKDEAAIAVVPEVSEITPDEQLEDKTPSEPTADIVSETTINIISEATAGIISETTADELLEKEEAAVAVIPEVSEITPDEQLEDKTPETTADIISETTANIVSEATAGIISEITKGNSTSGGCACIPRKEERRHFQVPQIEAKIGDSIEFKKNKIGPNWTPVVSNTILGKIIAIDHNSIELEILRGKSEFEIPIGKFTINIEDKREIKDIDEPMIQRLPWHELIEPNRIE